MKKLLSSLVILVLSLSVLTVTASADNVVLLDPVKGDLVKWNNAITYTYDEDGYVSGRTITTTSATIFANSTSSANATKYGGIQYRTAYESSDGSMVRGTPQSYWKNNFTWEFDFKFTDINSGVAPNSAINCFDLLFSDSSGNYWQNMIRFYMNKNQTQYNVRWAGSSGISSSNPAACELEVGKTYHLKIEADLRSGKGIYATFTNPETGYSRTSKSPLMLPNLPINNNILTDSVPTIMRTNCALSLELSNEKFYVDRFVAKTPQITCEDNTIKVSADAVNITDLKYWTYPPTLLCAVYDNENKLVASNKNNHYISNGIDSLGTYSYSTDVSVENLADGTYTVKAFVWNDLDKIQPYDNCLVEKTLTISGGAAVLSE